MVDLAEYGADLAARLPDLLSDYAIPGASIGITWRGDQWYGAEGVLSSRTGTPATPASRFQTGSIGKLLTAAATLQLLEDNGLSPDTRVVEVLPSFRVGSDEVTAGITFRHLLSHTSGFDGDCFEDTGDDDDALIRYVALLGDREQLFPPGRMFSYNNAGFCVAGRAVEVLSRRTFVDAVEALVLKPLGLTATAFALDGPGPDMAIGHLATEPGAVREVEQWSFPASLLPSGAFLVSTPRDVLAFTEKAFARDRRTREAQASSFGRDMTTPQVRLPFLHAMGSSWGLGPAIYDVSQGAVYGHDGGNIGQCAYVRAMPSEKIAVCVMTNTGDATPLLDQVVNAAFQDLASVTLPGYLPDLEHAPLPTRFLGSYANSVAEFEVTQHNDGLVMTHRPRGVFTDLSPESHTELVRTIGYSSFVEHDIPTMTPFTFVELEGVGRFLHDGRAAPWIGARTHGGG